MAEWWTYRPEDFLMFAPRTYWRLFELHNQAWWPLQWLAVLAVLAGLGWMVWAGRGGGQAALRWGAAGLAVACGFVGWAFIELRFAPVNWAASAWAVLFAALALCLALAAAWGGVHGPVPATRRRAGLLLAGWALLGHPLLSLAFGRPWAQAEWFALAPDPTVLAVLGWLLCTGAMSPSARLARRGAWACSLAWCALSAATLWTLGSAQGWVLFGAVAVAVAATRVDTLPWGLGRR